MKKRVQGVSLPPRTRPAESLGRDDVRTLDSGIVAL